MKEILTADGPKGWPVEKARILVADNVDTTHGMARLLELVGHEVTTAHSGPEAIEAARAHPPDFILLDIGLPGMSGYEIASRLRRKPCYHDALIAAISCPSSHSRSGMPALSRA